MLNEWQEFLDYTGPVSYKADGKKDTTWLGRFTLLSGSCSCRRLLAVQTYTTGRREKLLKLFGARL